MDIRQLQDEILAIDLLAKYQPIIEAIMTLTEGIDVMSMDRRVRWIDAHSLKISNKLFFVDVLINGTLSMGNEVLGLQNDSLGRLLSKKYSANDIIYACTYFEFLQGGKQREIVVHGNPPILKEEKKIAPENYERSIKPKKYSIVSDILYQEFDFTNCNVQFISTSKLDDESISEVNPLMSVDEIKTIIQGTPDHSVYLNNREFEKIRTHFVTGIETATNEKLLDELPSTSGNYIMEWGFTFENICNSINLQLENEVIVLPDVFSKYVSNNEKTQTQYKFFKTSSGYIIDSSTIDIVPTTYTTPDGEVIPIEVKVVKFLDVMIFDSFNQYPACYINYDPKNPNTQPKSFEEVKAAQVEVLKLPTSVLMNQMFVAYNGKQRPISYVSLDKWSKSNLSYGQAVEIMKEHVSYYSSIVKKDGEDVRVNNGTVYEQTRNKYEERLTDSEGVLNNAVFREKMSKYVYTVEETFFNLNENFSNPEKLLGYFLGMGISANNLHLNQINPYRILCARLLGIDYALNYYELCTNSVIAGHLFIDSFNEGIPIFCNADVLLDTNYYATKEKIETQVFQDELQEFFGQDVASQVSENHLKLLEEYSPKFMKLHHGTKIDYTSKVRNNGFSSPYKYEGADRMLEVTRITLALGLIESYTSAYGSATSMDKIIEDEYLKYLEPKYAVGLRSKINAKYKDLEEPNSFGSGNISTPRGDQLFQQYANKFDGTSLYGKAGNRLRNNLLDKEEAIKRFYFNPQSARAGAHQILRLGLTISNKELKDDGSPRLSESITINWSDRKKAKQTEPPVLDAKFIEEALLDPTSSSRNKLIDLGYDLDNEKERKELARIISIKAKGKYYEIASLARIEGDDLYSLAYALASKGSFDKSMEDLFNLKYNNFAYKPIDRIPIFLENNRTFGDTLRFIADSKPKDGSASGFSLRRAQKDGLRFLGSSGNSGLLAHEVGFGKTTSSIAKVSDMFLRGDAKRVLISVPNPVYDSGNWEEEISGTQDNTGRQRSNGLLPSTITLIKLGSMKFEDLKGKKITEGDPQFDEKSEGTGFDGAMKYSDSDLELMKVLSSAKDTLTEIVGGTKYKYGRDNTTSMLTPKEQKDGIKDFEDMVIEQNPFFKKSEEYKKENIVRINDTPRQSISGLVTTIKSGEFDFWDIGDSPYMEFGRLSDILDKNIDEEESLIKRVYNVLKSKSPNIEWDEKDGGDLKRIISKLEYIHKKYDNKYRELTTKGYRVEKKRRGEASIYGGALGVPRTSIVKTAKDNPDFDIDTSKYGGLLNGSTMTVPASYWIAVKTLEILTNPNVKENSQAWFPYIGTRSFWDRVVLPWAIKNHKNSPYRNISLLQADLEAEFPFTKFIVDGGNAVDPALEALAKAQIKTALELQMTEEIAYFFVTLSKQAPLFLGKFKDWAMRPNSVLLCSHLAIPKLSVSQEFGEQSIDFMAGIYGKSSPTQFLNARVKIKGVSQKQVVAQENKSSTFQKGVRTRGQKEKLFLSQYRGLDINQLSCDAFIVDEVHNVNRAFNNVKKGSRAAYTLGQGNNRRNPPKGGKVQANIKGSLRYPENVYAYDTKANYNIRAEIQNFISICLYFQERGRVISEGQKRKIENTIFLSATPFTDDNFQMLSLFGSMSASKLMQANVFNTFDFFQLYAKELWQKDIDYQNRYTLFPKIVGYKNIYSLSQLIKSFTNFKISDVEIEKERPKKVVVGTQAPRIKGVQDDDLDKVLSQVPFNEAQKKMNADLNAYITLESDSELSYTEAEYERAEEIFEKLQKKGKKVSPADSLVAKLIKKDKQTGEPPLVKIKKSKTSLKIIYELDNLLEIENLLNEITELDPDNIIAKQIRQGIDDTDIEDEEGELSMDDDLGVIDANALKSQDKSLSLAQNIAQRALEASRTQQLTLISPYYLTINNDKSLMNPYLPPLDGTPSENAKNVIENSPKLLYTCKAIRKVLEFAYNEKLQRYAGESESEPIMGQVVYANNYKFRYHGKDFFIFDLMTQYIIDENKELLETIIDKSGRDIKDLFASIDGRTKDKTSIVDDFNNGYCLVLFGTEIIKEGINLQKNCPIMYILQVGFVPVTYMQLHGRVWRQKNPYQYAFLINVLTQNSIDAFVYSKLENKIASVKQMLGSEVYDSEETQFDVDVAEIKINLITDPEKLAEMEYEDIESEASRESDRLKEELDSLSTLESKYPEARRVYELNFGYMNTFSATLHKYESYFLGKFYAEKTNTKKKEIATDKLVTAQYSVQFASEKIKEKFEENPDKYKGKDGKNKYESKAAMASRLSKTVKIKEMTLKEGIEMVQELNNSGDEDSEFRLSIKEPFDITSTTSLNAFVSATQSVYNVADRTNGRAMSLERNESRVKMLREYFEPAQKVLETLIKADMDKIDDFEGMTSALGVNAVRSNFRLKGKEVLIIACLEYANPDFVNNNTINDFAIERIAAKFRTGDESIIITDFNDIVSNEIVDGRAATIDDIQDITARKIKEQEGYIYTLNNTEEVKEKLRKEFAEKIKQRDGETMPTVDDRVDDLAAIFPYLNIAK